MIKPSYWSVPPVACTNIRASASSLAAAAPACDAGADTGQFSKCKGKFKSTLE